MAISKRTKPLFRLTNSTEVVVTRPVAPTYVNGRKVDGTPTKHTIEANVQKLTPNEMLLLSEADRTKEWIRLYVDPDQSIRAAREGGSGWEADSVTWGSLDYKVMKAESWSMGVLDHIKVYAARSPISAGV